MEKSEFYQLFEKIIENIIESRYIGIFQIIGKLSISKLDCLKLSVIWRNYRYRYRYRNFQENYRKIIVIEKNDLSLTPTQASRSCGTAGPAFLDSGGPSSIVKSPNIRCFVAKSGLSWFTRFLGVRFSAFDSNKYCQIGQWCYYYWFEIDSQSVLSIENICSSNR